MVGLMQAMWDATMVGTTTPEWEHEFSEDDDTIYHLVSSSWPNHTVLMIWVGNRKCGKFISGKTTSGVQLSTPSRSFGLWIKSISHLKNMLLMCRTHCPPPLYSCMEVWRSLKLALLQ